ncbi:unnamed protein product [Symbiodinium sp. CCMP2592]|nr:unnamed protein product [Symbiodinium sp. CCMP2592]
MWGSCRPGRPGPNREGHGVLAAGALRAQAMASGPCVEPCANPPMQEVQIEEQIVEVPTVLYQEKVVEVPKIQETILLKQVPRVEVHLSPIMGTLRVFEPMAALLMLCWASRAFLWWPVREPKVARYGLVDKLRAKGKRAKPQLRQVDGPVPLSSALPPGSTAPELRARAHRLIEGQPDLLDTVTKSSDFLLVPMQPEDAQDLADLQEEWFPKESCRGGEPWCAQLLRHPGVIAFKATIPQDETAAPVGIVVALASREAIEEFAGKDTADMLRVDVARPKYIAWDSAGGRELGYVLSLGSLGELRRRGLASALLRRAMSALRTAAKPREELFGGAGGPKDTSLRAVALHLAGYNRVARACYERAGFELLKVQEVTKEVARPVYEVTEKIVEVPHVLIQERIEEVPKIEYVNLVKQIPKTQVREVQKQVGVPVYQCRERVVEVPTAMVAEQMVEVPQVHVEELVKEVPRPEVQVVAKPIEKPVNEYVERVVEIPHTTIQECIVEVPKVEVHELVKQVPRHEVQVVDKQVETVEVQYVEKLVEVPHIIYEEKIVEVPTVEVREVIKQVSKPEAGRCRSLNAAEASNAKSPMGGADLCEVVLRAFAPAPSLYGTESKPSSQSDTSPDAQDCTGLSS